MKKPRVFRLILGLVIAWAGVFLANAGDSLYGKVTEVKAADRVVLDYGSGQYELRIVGIEMPRDEQAAAKATQFVSDLLLGKNARMRFQGRTESGEMRVRLFTDDPELGIKEVSVELVRAGLVRRIKGFDFSYGELAAAEKEAREAKRGLWAAEPQ
jgi:endonuclease YncB( thermonuclease family)